MVASAKNLSFYNGTACLDHVNKEERNWNLITLKSWKLIVLGLDQNNEICNLLFVF